MLRQIGLIRLIQPELSIARAKKIIYLSYLISFNRPVKSHGFAVGPTVLKQIWRSYVSFQKSHGKLKNGEKNYFPYLHLAFCRKKKCLFSTCTAIVFSTLFRTEYISIIKEMIKICSDHLNFFYLLNISVRETAACAFTFQIEETW